MNINYYRWSPFEVHNHCQHAISLLQWIKKIFSMPSFLNRYFNIFRNQVSKASPSLCPGYFRGAVEIWYWYKNRTNWGKKSGNPGWEQTTGSIGSGNVHCQKGFRAQFLTSPASGRAATFYFTLSIFINHFAFMWGFQVLWNSVFKKRRKGGIWNPKNPATKKNA